MSWTINPGVSLGPVRLGAERSHVLSVLGPPLTFSGPRKFGGGPQDFFQGSGVQVHYDRQQRVSVCTVWRNGPYLKLDRNCVWFMSPRELARRIEVAWGVPASEVADHGWMIAGEHIWFKWDGKRLDAVSVIDEATRTRIVGGNVELLGHA